MEMFQIKYGGIVSACGLAGGMDLNTTVAPFILRGVTLRGIESAFMDFDIRNHVYNSYGPMLIRSGKLDITSGKEQVPLKTVYPSLSLSESFDSPRACRGFFARNILVSAYRIKITQIKIHCLYQIFSTSL